MLCFVVHKLVFRNLTFEKSHEVFEVSNGQLKKNIDFDKGAILTMRKSFLQTFALYCVLWKSLGTVLKGVIESQ